MYVVYVFKVHSRPGVKNTVRDLASAHILSPPGRPMGIFLAPPELNLAQLQKRVESLASVLVGVPRSPSLRMRLPGTVYLDSHTHSLAGWDRPGSGKSSRGTRYSRVWGDRNWRSESS